MWDFLWIAVQITAVIITSGCFFISGIAKLRNFDDTAETFQALNVPKLFDQTFFHRGYPWLELVIGTALFASPPPYWWPIALCATLLLLTLSALTFRLLARGDTATCNCFGSRQPITKRTLVRNLGLSSLAALLLLSPKNPVVLSFVEAPSALFAALASAASAAALVVLSRGTAASSQNAQPTPGKTPTASKVPAMHLLNSHGEMVFLPSLVSEAPTLLVIVKEGCWACQQITRFFEGRTMIANRVAVQLVEPTPWTGPDPSRDRLWDYAGELQATLGLSSTPAAVLFSAVGDVPIPPAIGATEIELLVKRLEEAITQNPTVQ